MTEEQFKEAKEKVKKYSDIQSCIDRLKLDKYHISRGVMYMTVAPCKSEIDCCGRHEGFHIWEENYLDGNACCSMCFRKKPNYCSSIIFCISISYFSSL